MPCHPAHRQCSALRALQPQYIVADMLGLALRGATGARVARAPAACPQLARPRPVPVAQRLASRQRQPSSLRYRAQAEPEAPAGDGQQRGLVGEDAAVFNLEDQKAASWALFVALLTGVSALIYAVRPAR